ncbi:hypothetical protein AN958_04246 [Leucoagaricus sp. SymC.cos]|nr:hypothetical protein AN958_04246 [Leucoagaricus sp. SymC.cos]
MFTRTAVIIFDVLVLISVLLTVLTLLLAVLSRNVSQSAGWYGLMTGWVIYALSYGLIVGYQEGEKEPPLGVCAFQTLLIYAAPALVATNFLCYYVEFYLIISGLRKGKLRPLNQMRTLALATLPWLVFLIVIIMVLILIFPGQRLNLVRRSPTHFYCHLANKLPSTINAAIISVMIGIALPLEAWTGFVMYWHWDAFRRLGESDCQIYLTIYIRLTLSTICAVLAFSSATARCVMVDILLTILVLVAIVMVIAFGTQKDILRACLFWRREEQYASMIFKKSTLYNTTTVAVVDELRDDHSIASVETWKKDSSISVSLPTSPKSISDHGKLSF